MMVVHGITSTVPLYVEVMLLIIVVVERVTMVVSQHVVVERSGSMEGDARKGSEMGRIRGVGKTKRVVSGLLGSASSA